MFPTLGRVFATPVAKMLAEEKRVPLNSIAGSGPDGLIIKADLANVKQCNMHH